MLLEVLTCIADISNNRKLGFKEKLNLILHEIVNCIQVKKGSIMLLKDKKTIEVVASTNKDIIGATQSLEIDSPSTWVFRNKKPLYVDSTSHCELPIGRFAHYHGEAFFLVPIISNDRSIGVINVTEKIGTDIFNLGEREILLHSVGHIIIALENHRLADSLKKNQKLLEKKNFELRKLEMLRTELFNMLIHDLKGPISEIVANLDILSYTITDENINFVETAKTGCNTLFSMISNLLDIARLEEGKLPLLYEDILPVDLIKESLARLLVSVRLKELKFFEQYPVATALTFQGDRTLLIRVLQNLLTNAIQYSPHGETITIGFFYKEQGAIEFFVKDNGPGISAQYQDKIFDKYAQINKKSDTRMYTAGLGLSFCKMAVIAHGGNMGVTSDGNKGSSFYFVLPKKKKRGA